jgi:hypothetical protein
MEIVDAMSNELDPDKIGRELTKIAQGNKKDLSHRMEKYYNNPKLTDNKAYLALLVSMIESFVEQLTDKSFDNPKTLEAAAKAVDVASKVIERHHKQSVGYYVSLEKLEILQKVLIERIQFAFSENLAGCDCTLCPNKDACPRLESIGRYISSTPIPD